MHIGLSALEKLIAPAIAALGFEWVACEFHASGKRSTIRIYIDKEGGVTVDDCSFVSRQVGAMLEVENIIPGSYEIEVSSPGFDRLLVTPEHYQRFLGRKIKVRLHHPQAERRNFTGILQTLTDEKITLLIDGQTFTLALVDIEKANLIPEF